MSELDDAKDAIGRKKIENRKALDAIELVVLSLAIPEKAKLLCLYFLRVCDWLTYERDEGRAVLGKVLGCKEDQVSRYTRVFDAAGIIRIVSRGSNHAGVVHTYRIEQAHTFWSGDAEEVARVAEELRRSSYKRRGAGPDTAGTNHTPNAAIAELGRKDSRMRPSNQPDAAIEPAEHAALPLLSPLFPSPPGGREGGDEEFKPASLPPSPFQERDVTALELARLVETLDLVTTDALIEGFPSSSSWSPQLRDKIKIALSGQYFVSVFDGHRYRPDARCPRQPEIIGTILSNYVGHSPHDRLTLEIKRLYPDVWPNQTSGDLAIDEEKAALEWLKDADRSGADDNFLNKMRSQLLAGKALSSKQRNCVLVNWKRAGY